MTPKQIERIKGKISKIKRTLAAEKRKYGAYDDSRGMRYLPLRYFIQLQDYKGGLTYLRWFRKNFPDDMGFPDFLFEWTIILFKSGKTKEAATKAFETFCGNTYLFDKFLGRPIIQLEKWEGSNLETPEFAEHLEYSSVDPKLADFAQWLIDLEDEREFKSHCQKYIAIEEQLKTEQDSAIRRDLSIQSRKLQSTFMKGSR
tara:strand:- start:1889 stop:2491 length:603 start_codon:yes stop_codon:yes gene_type:complete